MKKIGIIGSRRRNEQDDYQLLYDKFIKIYEEGDIIVSGGCPLGGDRFAEIIAKKLGLTIMIHYPNWSRYGRAAGFNRNSKIAKDCDILLAVVTADRKGGTEDTIKKAKKLGKRIILILQKNQTIEEFEELYEPFNPDDYDY